MTDGSIAPVRSRRIPLGWQGAIHLLVVASVVLLNLVQQPGRVTFDTKLDLQLNPADLLARSTHLWNADWALGGLQNQASGYLFPMGPAFLVGELLDVPMWIWQRLWSALVMLLAYEGARRLARHWPGISSSGAVLAGLTYMLSPRVLTTVGGLSGEALPAAVLPWTVLPLVLYLRGARRGWVAFVLSAATIPWMGGQNATLVVACLVFPTVLLVMATGRSPARRVADLAGWGAMVAVATLWWVVPLLLLGAYAPPFLDFIESAANTAGDTGWLSSLRGTSHWVAFFPGGGSVGWGGGYELASSPWLLISTVLVSALGLIGLLQRRLWQGRALATAVLVGLVVLTAGSGGWAGSVLADAWLHALDTSLAPLRNIHKFDPVVRLPLALGLGAWVTTGVPRAWRPTWWSGALPIRGMAVAVTGLLVLAAATPAATGSLRVDDGFRAIPTSWQEAVDYLDDRPGTTRAMVLPGAGFAVQTWGRTIDEPIQVLDPVPWTARAQVTVAPAGTLRLLDSVEGSVAETRPQEGLAVALEGMGITHLVVRNDLDLQETGAPPPDVVRATLSKLPGARVVATFGERTDGGPDVAVYEIEHESDPRIDVQDWSSRAVVAGGPEVVPDLRAMGLVADDQAVVLATAGLDPDVVTDSLRRVERSFGRVHDARSAVMTPQDRYRASRQAHDYLDDAMPGKPTVAAYDGAEAIVASSSGGYVDILGPVRPNQHPFAAFDASFYTAWETAPYASPRGQWLEARFEEPTSVDTVSLQFDTSNGVGVTTVRVATDNRSVVTDVNEDGSVQGLQVGDAAASRLRVTVLDAVSATGQVRLSNVHIDGHQITRSLVLPATVSSDDAVFVSSEAPRRACAVTGDYYGDVTCDARRQRTTTETAGFRRTFTTGDSGTWALQARAIATNGPELERLFTPLRDDMVQVVASSSYGGDPAVTAAGVVDGLHETGWTSAAGDPAATLALRWGPRRTVTSLGVSKSEDHPGQLPPMLVVDAGPGTGGPQYVATTGPDAGQMRPVRTRRLRITAVDVAGEDGIGISELGIRGIEDLLHEPAPDTPTGTVCGFGPVVEISGQDIQTRLTGTLEDIRTGGELDVVPCDDEGVSLPAGEHTLSVTNPSGFAVTDLALTPPTQSWARSSAGTDVRTWSASEREVEVSVGSESVLAVSESFNRGWTASVDGTALRPVVLEGWKQGFVLPAGTTGVVELEYAPQTGFRAALAGGLLLAGVLMLVALVLLMQGRRNGRPDLRSAPAEAPNAPRGRWRWAAQVGMLLALSVVSLPLAAGSVLGRAAHRVAPARVAAACTLVLVLAALIAIARSSVVVPPAGSDILGALAVGVVLGRVLTRA